MNMRDGAFFGYKIYCASYTNEFPDQPDIHDDHDHDILQLTEGFSLEETQQFFEEKDIQNQIRNNNRQNEFPKQISPVFKKLSV